MSPEEALPTSESLGLPPFSYIIVIIFLTDFPFFRSNFLGTKFTVYDAQPTNPGAQLTRTRSTRLLSLKQVSPRVPSGNYPVSHISYELNVLGSR